MAYVFADPFVCLVKANYNDYVDYVFKFIMLGLVIFFHRIK